MIKTINFSDFCDAWEHSGRKNSFSYEGKKALFEHLEEYEESTGEKVELDIVALDCDYTEYENLEEIHEVYDQINTMDQLQDHTQVIEFNGGIIIQNF